MSKTKSKHHVVIRSENCKGCGICAEFCKSGTIAMSEMLNTMGYRYAEPVEGAACTGCMICTMVCPDLVIEVYDE